MKLLCFGDSNTYGYDPRSYFGGRYDAAHRWVDLLAQKSGWEILNAGENGREIPKKEGELYRFKHLLVNAQPLDRLLVMLGGNDLLQGNRVAAVSARMKTFLSQIPLDHPHIVLIAPPPMKPGAWITDERLLADSLQLITAYQELAEQQRIPFVNTETWGIDLTFDGVHFSENGHQTFAERLWSALQ